MIAGGHAMSKATIAFHTVSREMMGIIARRRELLGFRAAALVATSVFLSSLIDPGTSPLTEPWRQYAFSVTTGLLFLLCFFTCLRDVHLNWGLIFHATLYQKCVSRLDPGLARDLRKDGTINPLSSSFLE